MVTYLFNCSTSQIKCFLCNLVNVVGLLECWISVELIIHAQKRFKGYGKKEIIFTPQSLDNIYLI